MSDAPMPTIRNSGTAAIKPRKLFVNVPVADLQRSINFFEELGFAFNMQFTDATATCMLVGTDAYFMLLTKDKFNSFAKKPLGDSQKETNALFTFSAESRDEVDELYNKALANGGKQAGDMQDHGFMYGRAFYDLDGHHWELFWMDPSAVNG